MEGDDLAALFVGEMAFVRGLSTGEVLRAVLCHVFQKPLGKLSDEARHVPVVAPLGDLSVLHFVTGREAVGGLLTVLERPHLRVIEKDDVALKGTYCKHITKC